MLHSRCFYNVANFLQFLAFHHILAAGSVIGKVAPCRCSRAVRNYSTSTAQCIQFPCGACTGHLERSQKYKLQKVLWQTMVMNKSMYLGLLHTSTVFIQVTTCMLCNVTHMWIWCGCMQFPECPEIKSMHVSSSTRLFSSLCLRNEWFILYSVNWEGRYCMYAVVT